MRDFQQNDDGVAEHPQRERPGYRASEIVSLLGGPVFVDMRPGHVRVICQGFTGVGPDRVSAFRELADRIKAVATS